MNLQNYRKGIERKKKEDIEGKGYELGYNSMRLQNYRTIFI